MSVRIVIADDHAVFRSGLKALLQAEGGVEVVGEAGSGPETIEVVRRTSPDLVLLDISMPGLGGARVAEALLRDNPELPIVVLTMHEDETYLQELFKIGVRAYVLKKSSGTDVVQAIRAASRGEQYVDAALARHVISSYVGRSARKAGRLEEITPREQEVVSLLAYGHTNGEIAEKLHISERTVETHRANAMAKLALGSRAELVRFAIEHGLLKLR